MPRRAFDPDAVYQPFSGASRITGLSVGFLREGCKNGKIPHVMAGKEYRVCMPLLLQQLEAEAASSLRKEI